MVKSLPRTKRHQATVRPLGKLASPLDCEEFCKRIVAKGTSTISKAAVEQALSLARISFSTTRKNVIPHGEKAVQGAVCGLVVFLDFIGVSMFSQRYPWLTRLLVALCRKEKPGFNFTSIQINVNYATRPHVDKNNLGKSYIIGFGKYTGGELWKHDDSGNKPHVLSEDIVGSPMYKKGDTYMGRDVSIHNRWVEFDGNLLHLTRPFQGSRYSLVYFTCDRYAQSEQKTRDDLKSLGFPFRWECVTLQKMLATKKNERGRIQKLFFQKRNSLHQGVVPQLHDSDKVMYAKENPKQKGSNAWKLYNKYSRAKTLGEAVALGARAIDLVFDYNHGFMCLKSLDLKSVEWDFVVKWPKSMCGTDHCKTALGAGQSKTVKVRVSSMNELHKGVDVPRKTLSCLAACVPKLRRLCEEEWVKKSSPTAALPLNALRSLLHWASTGRLYCKRGHHKETICSALKSWGVHQLAAHVQNEGQQNDEASHVVAEPCSTRIKRATKRGSSTRLTASSSGCSKTTSAPTKKAVAAQRHAHALNDDDRIRFVQGNPKIAKTMAHRRYERYKKARSVKQALELGAYRGDVRHDFQAGFCKRYRVSNSA